MAIQFGEFCYTFVSHTTNIFLPLQISVIWQPRNVPTVHPQVQSLVSSAARLLGYIWSKMFDLNDSTCSQSRGATITLHPGNRMRRLIDLAPQKQGTRSVSRSFVALSTTSNKFIQQHRITIAVYN